MSYTERFDLVPAKLPDDFYSNFPRWVVQRVESERDLMRFVMIDAAIKRLDDHRKQENKKLIELAKQWEEKKRELRPQLLAYLSRYGDQHKKIDTPAGQVYRSARAGGVHLSKMSDDDGVDWLCEHATPPESRGAKEDTLVRKGLAERKLVLTSAGKRAIKDLVELDKSLPLPKGVERTPDYETVAVSPKKGWTNNEFQSALVEYFSQNAIDAEQLGDIDLAELTSDSFSERLDRD